MAPTIPRAARPTLRLIVGGRVELRPDAAGRVPASLRIGPTAPEGGLFGRLCRHPEAFDEAEFEHLTEGTFAHRLSGEDKLALLTLRIERCLRAEPLERDLLLAMVGGDEQEVQRLRSIIDRRDALRLRVVVGRSR